MHDLAGPVDTAGTGPKDITHAGETAFPVSTGQQDDNEDLVVQMHAQLKAVGCAVVPDRINLPTDLEHSPFQASIIQAIIDLIGSLAADQIPQAQETPGMGQGILQVGQGIPDLSGHPRCVTPKMSIHHPLHM
jgi:hypothetical protein